MIISKDKNIGYINEDANIYDILLEFSDFKYQLREYCIKYEHYSIVNESSQIILLETEKKNLFQKAKDLVFNLVKKFKEWLMSIREFFQKLKYSAKKFKKSIPIIQQVLKNLNIPDNIAKEYPMRNLKKDIDIRNDSENIFNLYDGIMKEVNDAIQYMRNRNFEKEFNYGYGPINEEKEKNIKEKALKIALEDPDDTNEHPLTKEYILKQKDDIIDFCNGSQLIDDKLIKELEDLKNKMENTVIALGKIESQFLNTELVFGAKSIKSSPRVIKILGPVNFLTQSIDMCVKTAIGCINGIKEKNIQVRQMAIILIRLRPKKIKNVNDALNKPLTGTVVN